MLEEIRGRDVVAGVAFNPDTSLAPLESCADLCDMVLVMSVQAGFGGQVAGASDVADLSGGGVVCRHRLADRLCAQRWWQ